jgi:DNA invertase Pin-like site-specific DNA recombinase
MRRKCTKAPDKSPDLAFSYVRFSTREQAKGDSMRRQLEATREWCERNGVRLDETITLHELGKSAFTGAHRKNPDTDALARFLDLVKTGRVPKGSVLVLENLDRLTREHIQPALLLILGLLQDGIRIVQLKPTELIFDSDSDSIPIMLMIVELMRGHGESLVKSQRVGEAWKHKKQCAREGKPQPARKDDRVNGKPYMTRNLPEWIARRDGKPVIDAEGKLTLNRERAAVVKRIFHLAANGYGRLLIAKKLIKDGVAPWGKAGHWNGSYIGQILLDRRALGEHQPKVKRTRQADGEPIPGYFPAVVTEKEWLAARAGILQRGQKRGRTGKTHVNIFAGLIRDAVDGSNYHVTTTWPSHGRGGGMRVLINQSACEGWGKSRTFPFPTFEAAILSCLQEIDPREILNGDSGKDETQTLAAELAGIEALIAKLTAALEEEGDVLPVVKKIKELEARKVVVNAQLAEARQKAAHPLSESWGEGQTLIDALATANDPYDARIRLRSCLRQIVDCIWILAVPNGQDRLARVDIYFKGNATYRTYQIIHRPPRSNGRTRVEGCWATYCDLGPDTLLPEVDLRPDTPKHDPFTYNPKLGEANYYKGPWNAISAEEAVRINEEQLRNWPKFALDMVLRERGQPIPE